jgi:hypothetical protein
MGINHFFQNLRRKNSMLERPISTPSGLNRKWYGYSPYNPTIINKILLVHRVWYNYVKRKRRMTVTPAMKLGLAKAPIDPEVIIYGRTVSESPIIQNKFSSDKSDRKNDYLKNPEPFTEPKFNTTHKWDNAEINAAGDEQRSKGILDTVYLDVETTGLSTKDDEIIEITIVDEAGEILINSLVNSKVSIHPNASKIHGITKKMLAKAPIMAELEKEIISLIRGKCVVTYPSSFDIRLLSNSIMSVIADSPCCMLEFAEYYGRLHNEPWPYQWQSLKFAAGYVDYKWIGPQHRALGDALACRAVWQYMIKNPIDYN